MSNTPSDAEIIELMRDGYNCRYNDEADHIEFARAVLAKWGTQPQAGAVPQGWKAVPVNPTPEMWKAAKSVPGPNPPYPPHYGLVWDAMLAASPTPPAEQQATKETSGGFHVWRDISTAPKDGSRFVATGHNYELYGEVRHTCVAQWFQGCWMEASDWNETSELRYLTHWTPLPSPPDDVAAPAEQQAAPKAAPAWADQAVIEYRYTGGTHWCPLGPAERMKPDFDGVYRLQEGGVFPVEQAAPKAAPTRTALPEGWTDCTIEFGNDGPEVVAYGPKRMMNRLAKWLGKYFAQAVAVPLTDAQIAEMMRDTWGCASIALRHALEFARAVERAHGIAQKGGS